MSVSTIYRVYFGLPEELLRLISANKIAMQEWDRVRASAFYDAYTIQIVGGGSMVCAEYTNERSALEADSLIMGAANHVLQKFSVEVKNADGR